MNAMGRQRTFALKDNLLSYSAALALPWRKSALNEQDRRNNMLVTVNIVNIRGKLAR